MSSSDGENFDLDNVSGSESDGYMPVKKSVCLVFINCFGFCSSKQTKAPAKKAATKAKPASKPAVKAKSAPKKKVLADINENADDSVMDIDRSDDEQAQSIQREDPAPKSKKKTASETYTKVCRVYIDV